MTYDVRQLAEAAGLSVEVVRSYQSKGLLSAPKHEGRTAIYDSSHLDRLEKIKALKSKGLSLRAVADVLAAGPDSPWSDHEADYSDERLTRAELAERARVPPSMLRSLEGSGVLRPLPADDAERPYSRADVRAVRMLLALVSAGVPMEEFMAVARLQIETSELLAEGASKLFLRYVREPMLNGEPHPEAAEEFGDAFSMMVQAASWLVGYHVERTLVAAMAKELANSGTDEEREALHRAFSVIDATFPA
ncbi:MAG TPA: MerR family transcriptional regulator [Acidimicrobiales bacterium]|nr:MerR family transcriptional regulator [Acidimicrobiales bacterium]